MIERIIENWLTSCNERQFQLPFCQLLTAEGETVIYISPHGQREQGKDVITLGPGNVPRAYQLKQGRLALSAWRNFVGEINELVEYPIDHPRVKRSHSHQPVLVTNGSYSDTVLSAVSSANASWARRKFHPLKIVNGQELVTRFVRAHGRYLPSEPRNFRQFLELVLDSGKSPLDKRKLASFLETALQLDRRSRPTPREARRAVTSAALLASYILQSCEQNGNWWALFEGWTLTAAHFIALASKFRVPERWWRPSFELCELSAVRALEQLCQECETNKTLLTEGNPLTDGYFYYSRITILLGLLCSWNLYLTLRRETRPKEDFIRAFCRHHVKNIRLWGESATPLLMETALQIEKFGEQLAAETLVIQLIDGITRANAKGGQGVPDPYFGPEEALRMSYGLDTSNTVEFRGHSYSLQPCVDFLARRLRRQALARWWAAITRVQFTAFRPPSDWEWFTWRAKTGKLETRFPTERQSWSVLRRQAESRDTSGLPQALKRDPAFALFFAIVYPHRFDAGLLRLLEDAVDTATR